MIRDARVARWRAIVDFANATGLSVSLIDDIENGRRERYRDSTLSAIEAALGWQPGSARRITEGGQPRLMTDELLGRLHIIWPRLSSDARRILVALAEIGADSS